MGHRHSLYRGHPLSEGALVAETCNLIYANLDENQVLLCERMYRTFVTPPEGSDVLTPLVRADLVIATLESLKRKSDESIAEYVNIVIEVKRGNAPWSEIKADLLRLAMAHQLSRPPGHPFRCFLFVICEAHRNKRFIVTKGKSNLEKRWIDPRDETLGYYRVRRTCKAAASFTNRETAHYACLIEVYSLDTDFTRERSPQSKPRKPSRSS